VLDFWIGDWISFDRTPVVTVCWIQILKQMAEAERYQHYKVLRREDGSLWELGRGAMGVTYKAFDTNLRCPVALKVINNSYLNSEIARQRFLREARAAASLRHQNVASVFHLGTDHESYFYAMEFVDGETVDVYIKRKGLLDPVEALGIVIQVSRALSAADKEKLVHRDLKPSNLMLVHEEEEMVVKVIDFGLAKSTEKGAESSGTLTVGGGFVGTPHFASPEQLEERELDIRSDIYSLGATLYYMLTGRPPYAGSLAQVMSQHLYKPVPLESLEGFPPCVVELIRRMMEKDPAKRPQRPGDLRREILPCLNRLEASASGARSIAEKPNAGEHQLDPLATLDLSTERPGVEESASLIAQRYKIISELGDLPQGRRFLTDDRRRNRQVSLIVLSRDFVSDSKRYMALEHEIDRLRRSTNPLLRQVYSLESTAQQSFLVEEYVVGPTLLEVLRARGFLSPAETWLLLNLLAPVADDAQSNELQQVDFTLSGIQLTSPRLTENWTASDVLRRPLTRWEQLGVKVSAVDFSLSVSDTAAWGGAATLIQAVPGGGPRASYLRLLSLLVYELLGGPRSTVELTGRYSPVAGLSEQGNALLRRGLMDDFQSATELARQLGGEIVARNVDPVTTTPPPASSPEVSLGKSPSATPVSSSPPTQPGHFAGQQPAPASSTGVKGRRAPAKTIAILVLVAILGAAGYFLRQFFLAPPSVSIEQSTASTSSAQPRIPPKPQTGAVTEAGGAGSVGAAIGATPGREVPASPTPVAVTTPDAGTLTTPGPVAAATRNRETPVSPSPVSVATPNRETLTTPSPVAIATPNLETLTTPRPSAVATPNAETLATPSSVAVATPDREALATPSPIAVATPNGETLVSPSPVSVATPNREALAAPSPVAAATPNLEALATPSQVAVTPDHEAPATPSPVAAATPNRQALETPSPVAAATPDRGALATPSPVAAATPNRETLATPSPVAVAIPDREALATPSSVAAATPNREALATPSPIAAATPDRETLATPSPVAVATPNREVLATPSPVAVATPGRETLATPSPVTDREAEASPSAGASPEILAMVKRDRTTVPGTELPEPERHAVQTSSSAENYSERLDSAQRLIESTDWPGALKAYVDLIDQYPERPAARQSLGNLLNDLSANATLVDPESSALMKPDLIRAAEAGIVPAMLMLARSSRESDRAAALKWYQAAAAKGSVEGMKKAGSLLYSNHLRPEDDLKALDYFTQAANTGDPEGAYLAGECYYFGKGTAPDMDKAVQFLQLAASRRDVRAMDLLGTCYRKQGKFELARRSFEGAATAGYALSYFNLGVMYMNGEGVPRSPRKGEDQFRHSAELFRQGAEKGDPVAMFYFASWSEQGIGVPKDGKTATEWYRRSARAGYPQAIEWCRRNSVAP
jgi:serine/threonine protein kinase/TPR repeat protein